MSHNFIPLHWLRWNLARRSARLIILPLAYIGARQTAIKTQVSNRNTDNMHCNKSENNIKTYNLRAMVCEIGRNPIPDYYSITLEISRDRTTSALQVTCSEQSTCPSSVDVGDVFLRRDINAACHKMVGLHWLCSQLVAGFSAFQFVAVFILMFNGRS